MTIKKLLIATISFTLPLTASTAVMADDDDDDAWDDEHTWNADDDDDWGSRAGSKKAVRLRGLQLIDKGERLVVRGELEGLKKKQGDKPVKLVARARGDAQAVCINPGGNIPSGKNPVDADEVVVIGRAQFDLGSLYKGVLEFKVATDRPKMKIDGAPDCPNPKWTEKIFDIAFTEVELDVVQDGKKLLELECFFDEPTKDGKVPKKQFDCEVR